MGNLDHKFSISEVYEQLEPFMIYLCGRFANDDVMFQFDELYGELQLELVKGYNYYYKSGKIEDLDSLFAVLRKMFDNRIGELRYRHYSTHRGKAKLNISIDVQMTFEDDDLGEVLPDTDYTDPEQLLESEDRLIELRSKLSAGSIEVVDALLNDNPRLDMLLVLMALRSIGTGKSPKIRPSLVADAMLIDTKKVEKAFKEIKKVYAEVCDE